MELLEGLGWDAEDVDGAGIVDDSETVGDSERPDCCIAIASVNKHSFLR